MLGGATQAMPLKGVRRLADKRMCALEAPIQTVIPGARKGTRREAGGTQGIGCN